MPYRKVRLFRLDCWRVLLPAGLDGNQSELSAGAAKPRQGSNTTLRGKRHIVQPKSITTSCHPQGWPNPDVYSILAYEC
eukprot:836446-Pelagomonas_calceolata.AAC.4